MVARRALHGAFVHFDGPLRLQWTLLTLHETAQEGWMRLRARARSVICGAGAGACCACLALPDDDDDEEEEDEEEEARAKEEAADVETPCSRSVMACSK